MPCETDLYFTVEATKNAARSPATPRAAELRPIPSIWGHRAGNPAAEPSGRRIHQPTLCTPRIAGALAATSARSRLSGSTFLIYGIFPSLALPVARHSTSKTRTLKKPSAKLASYTGESVTAQPSAMPQKSG